MPTIDQQTTQVTGSEVRPGDTVIDRRGLARRIDAFDRIRGPLATFFAPVRGVRSNFFGPARVGYTREDGTWRPAGVFAADDEVTVTLPRPPRHTITIEPLTDELERELGPGDSVGVSLLVVERVNGALVRICGTDEDLLPGVTIADIARVYSDQCSAELLFAEAGAVSVEAAS